jgi:hypothetical protein
MIGSFNQATQALHGLAREIDQAPQGSPSTASQHVRTLALAIDDLKHRIQAIELVMSTLAKKAGLTESQIHRHLLPDGAAPSQQEQYAATSAHLQRLLALADS